MPFYPKLKKSIDAKNLRSNGLAGALRLATADEEAIMRFNAKQKWHKPSVVERHYIKALTNERLARAKRIKPKK